MAADRQVELWGLPARPHLVLPCRIDPRGLSGPTEDQARGPGWRRCTWGRYLPTSIPLTTEQRVLEASMCLPAYGGVTGWAGLNWAGATRWFDGLSRDGMTPLDVCLAVAGDDVRPQAGVRISAERLDPRDLMIADGVSVTTPVRSACFEMRYAADVRQAAVVLSMAAYSDHVSVEEMAEYASRHSGWTGIPRCRAAIALAEENCWSPTEVHQVLIWRVDAELPRPLCNRPVFDRAGNHIGTPDLLDVEAGVVGQYDGSFHLTGAQRSRDVRAEDRYRRLGLECFTMLSSDLAHPGRMAERMHAARARARWQAESQRDWTADYPPWWTPTHTVELRRALTPAQRRRLLGYRAA